MSDLISRSKAISILEQLEEHSLTGKMDISNAIYLLNNQPTAYDIDKVVEELGKLQTYNMSLVTLMSDLQRNGVFRHYICLEDAIEIVKQGCVSDDVCEWKQDKGCVGLGAYNISCCDKTLEMPVSTARGLKYCTYCGKKIKVVE